MDVDVDKCIKNPSRLEGVFREVKQKVSTTFSPLAPGRTNSLHLGMIIPFLIRNPYNGYIKTLREIGLMIVSCREANGGS